MLKRLKAATKGPAGTSDGKGEADQDQPKGGLKNLRRIVQAARVQGATSAVKIVAREFGNAQLKQQMAQRAAKQAKRKPSVDLGNTDWPTRADMNEDVALPGESVEELTAVVAEIHQLHRPDVDLDEAKRALHAQAATRAAHDKEAVAAKEAAAIAAARAAAAAKAKAKPERRPSVRRLSLTGGSQPKRRTSLDGSTDGARLPPTRSSNATTAGSPSNATEDQAPGPAKEDDNETQLAKEAAELEQALLPTPREAYMQLPREADLADYPQEVWAHIRACAAAILAACVVPRLRLRQARAMRLQRKERRLQLAAPLTPELLQRIPIYRSWPSESLRSLVKSARFVSYAKGEVLVYDREPSSSTLFVAKGTVAVLPRGMNRELAVLVAPRPKPGSTATGLSASNPSAPLPAAIEGGATFKAGPVVFGDLNVVVDEPWPQRLVAATACDVYELTREDVAAEMAKLPDTVAVSTQSSILKRRNTEMAQLRPFTAAMVRECGLLQASGISDGFAQDLASRVEPNVFSGGSSVMREGGPVEGVYFVRRGRIKVTRIVNGESTLLRFGVGPTVVGDIDVVANGTACLSTVDAITDLDAYLLPKLSYQLAIRNFEGDVDKLAQALAHQRRDDLRRNLLRHKDLAYAVPFFRDLDPSPFDVRDFLLMLQPKTYKPMSSVCSQSQFADRLILVTKGQLRVGDDASCGAKSCLGWTCVVPHRWGRNCMTGLDPVDVLELDGDAYRGFLEQRGMLERVKAMSLAMLFPKAHGLAAVSKIQASLPASAVVVHPTSNSAHVNLNDLGFCTVHMSELKRRQKQETANRESLKLQTPPPFRALSASLWLPKSQFSRGFAVSKQASPNVIGSTPPPLPGVRVRKR